jgi:CRP/FNR family transcriptional regulator/voltage-gated potassium channel
LGSGDFFGEVAVMKHVARSASVRAVEDTECLVVRMLDLESFIDRYPGIDAKMESALSRRFDD